MENLLESFLLMVAGMAATLSVLGALAGLIWVLKTVDEKLNSRRIKTYADKVETHKVDVELNDEVVAVLAAVASVVLKRPISIRRVRFLKPATEEGAWAVTGRLNIMASHAISRRKAHS